MARAWAKFTKEQVLQAIEDSYGIVSQVMRNLQRIARDTCEWHTAQTYIEHWAETRQAFADENERALDFSESQMLGLIRAMDGPMIRFHLTTKGKHRGYVPREERELSGKDGEPLIPKVIELVMGEETEEERRLVVGDDGEGDDSAE
jgi:hypothetical protein